MMFNGSLYLKSQKGEVKQTMGNGGVQFAQIFKTLQSQKKYQRRTMKPVTRSELNHTQDPNIRSKYLVTT